MGMSPQQRRHPEFRSTGNGIESALLQPARLLLGLDPKPGASCSGEWCVPRGLRESLARTGYWAGIGGQRESLSMYSRVS
jgi:hypothetical protein